jgi:hypothetical protein
LNTLIPPSVPRDDFSHRTVMEAIERTRQGDAPDAVFQAPMVRARGLRIVRHLQAIGVIPAWKVTPAQARRVFIFAVDVMLSGMPLEGGVR